MADVKDGDCIVSIAEALGFRDYKALWAANDTLKAKRPNPNMLVVGDAVVEPPKAKKETKANGQRWTYVVKAKKPASLRIVLLGYDNKPLADAAWELTAPVAKSGTTPATGLIEIPDFPPAEKAAALKVTPKKPPAPVIPPAAAAVDPPPYPAPVKAADFKDKVRAADPADDFVEWTLKVGSLPSFNDDTGVLARLFNLGAACEPGDDGKKTERTVKAYQKAFMNQDAGSGLPKDIQTDLRDRHDKKP